MLKQTQEKPFYFDAGRYNLFGVLHTPADAVVREEGFVFCAPLAEEKLWCHRVLVNFARELAARGYSVLRFDFMGHGDSDGHFENSTIRTRIEDIKAAVRELRQQAPSIGKVHLLGLRFGATLASLAAEELGLDGNLILWEPIVKGPAYGKELLRINLATQVAVYRQVKQNSEQLIAEMEEGKTVNIDGYEMSLDLYRQIVEIDLTGDETFEGGVYLAKITNRIGKTFRDFEALKQHYRNCHLEVVVEEPFWKEIKRYYPVAENLFEKTLEWLEEKRP